MSTGLSFNTLAPLRYSLRLGHARGNIVFGIQKRTVISLCILSGEIGGTKTSAENLFSLPICVIMELAKSLPPGGRETALAVEGARVTLSLD